MIMIMVLMVSLLFDVFMCRKWHFLQENQSFDTV